MRGCLEELLGKAGAVFVPRNGVLVAAHFGSVAAELAVCRQGVGVIDRSDLRTLELRGTPGAIAHVSERVTGLRPITGSAHLSAGAWWGAVTDHRILIVAEPAAAADLAVVVATATRSVAGASLIDLADDYAAVGLVGPRAALLARDTRLLPRELPTPPAPGTLITATDTFDGLRPALLLCEDPERLLVLVPAAHGAGAWTQLMAAGRMHGASCVGTDALVRLRAVRRPAPIA
jgi:glycine cleavage system aminomethyltransferase T